MDRTKQIQRRQVAINRGAIAESTLRELGPLFEEAQAILLSQFIKNSKQLGKLDEHVGHEIIALSDVRTLLVERIQAGNKAAEARRKDLERQTKNAGGSDI